MRKHPDRLGGYPISYRAFGILAYAAATGVRISGENLYIRGNEGKEATYKAMRELRQMSFIETISVKINGKWVKNTVITGKGQQYLAALGLPFRLFEN
jgi:hypothetical protein